jgi:phosphoglycerol geranylgeranyltransferase
MQSFYTQARYLAKEARIMNVWKTLESALSKGKVHMTLLDPDKLPAATIAGICAGAAKAGTDAIMLGGSTGITVENLDAAIAAIKGRTSLPVILFPMGAKALSGKADAIYFMSLMNSRNLRFVIGEQVAGAPVIKALGLEPISMGYIIVEPGMKVGEVGEADPIPRNEPKKAVAQALAAQYFGMKLVYLEAGSGAHSPVPDDMVSSVKRAISIPLVVGGGVRRPEQARALAKAGADVLVTGTLAEESADGADLAGVIKAFKGL